MVNSFTSYINDAMQTALSRTYAVCRKGYVPKDVSPHKKRIRRQDVAKFVTDKHNFP
ncbi:hypothetical protein AEAC466_07840 [Asticcacaulis sp. AC466]|nr:hypothetical protein AEAC466_07840 [Asticcacaulis sp. AC466]